ncbi:Enoyl-CoA hydratase 2 peroxisomal [Zea mays]|uniref:Enoyl-CoA hydratase 2 peroxisomal n=1 Tax=Zea mays TaxID=4577 RepID=A0A1D6EUB1_MAIZE|nr:Enoyl-CoA hydratase 2 peroxisomal [Zea mays]
MATSSKPAAPVDPMVVLAHEFPEVSFDYDERDVALYALGVGACGDDAVDEKELHFVYHRDGQPHIKLYGLVFSAYRIQPRRTCVVDIQILLQFDVEFTFQSHIKLDPVNT